MGLHQACIFFTTAIMRRDDRGRRRRIQYSRVLPTAIIHHAHVLKQELFRLAVSCERLALLSRAIQEHRSKLRYQVELRRIDAIITHRRYSEAAMLRPTQGDEH